MTAATIPDGGYAVVWQGTTRFYRLRTSTWRGAERQWVNRYRSSTLDRVGKVEEASVRAAIAADTERAARAFGLELGVCSVCYRTLTDETSRALGIGPVCATRGDITITLPSDAPVAAPVAVEAEPARDERGAVVPAGTLTIAGGIATLVSEYDAAAVAFARTVPGRKWDATAKVNTFPVNATTAPLLAEMVETFGYAVVGDALPDVAQIRAQREANVEASHATDAALELDGLGGELLPFQRAGVAYAVANDSVLIGDEMGLGKTVQALAALAARGAFPALVVVPAVVKLNWERETQKWLPGHTVEVLSGRTTHVTTADVVIVNYDILSYWKDSLLARGFAALVLDESHYVKSSKAARSKAAKAIARKVSLRMLLTGTPVLNRPVELINQLDILGHLDDFGGFWGFAKRYCGAFNNGYGWDFSGASHLDELHDKLRQTCYVRRTKEQVLTELPAKRRATVAVEMADRDHYDAVEADLRNWIEEQVAADADFLATLEGLDDDEAVRAERMEIWRREQRARRAEMLVKISALRQVAAAEKLDAASAWIAEFLESGKKLVVFAHHKDIVTRAAAAVRALGVGVVTLTGSTAASDRQAVVDAFQTDDSVRVLIGNIQAAGVGITLTAASDVAFLELPWRPGDLDQAEDRCHRIGQHDSVTAWYLLARDSIEEEMAKMLDAKRGVVEAATDGREVASTSILAGLVAAIAGRAA